jgi:PiT family inorganic phosphate transporter
LAGRVATAWLITLPCAGVCGALAFYGQRAFGVSFGVVVMTAILIGYCSFIYYHSRKDKINADNVNDKWGEHSEAFEKPLEPVEEPVKV